jgi:hypothetical protein
VLATHYVIDRTGEVVDCTESWFLPDVVIDEMGAMSVVLSWLVAAVGVASLVVEGWRGLQPRSRIHLRGSKASHFLGTVDLERRICLGKLGRLGRCLGV